MNLHRYRIAGISYRQKYNIGFMPFFDSFKRIKFDTTNRKDTDESITFILI